MKHLRAVNQKAQRIESNAEALKEDIVALQAPGGSAPKVHVPMGCTIIFSPGWEVDSAGGTAGLCQPVERDIYDCYATCFWPAQVPDHLNNSPDWTSKCASATKDWRNVDIVFPDLHNLDPLNLEELHARHFCLRGSFALGRHQLCRALRGGQLMYLGVWPHTVLVMDSAQGKIVDKIDLPTDIVRTLVLSPDEKTLYASTLKDNSIVSIDLATRKVMDKFSLNTSDTNYRIGGFAVDPTGKFIYTFATPVVKKIDHYQIDPPQILEVSLAARKITRIVPYPKDEPPPAGYRNTIRVSPDGKLLYLFRNNIMVFNTSDFKFVKKIELAKPTDPSSDGSFAGLVNDPNEPSGKVIGIFDSSDPYVHRRVFGIAELDLANMTYDLTPVGPAAEEMEPLDAHP